MHQYRHQVLKLFRIAILQPLRVERKVSNRECFWEPGSQRFKLTRHKVLLAAVIADVAVAVRSGQGSVRVLVGTRAGRPRMTIVAVFVWALRCPVVLTSR